MIPVSITIDGVEYDAVLTPPDTLPCMVCLLGHVCFHVYMLCSLAKTEPCELIHYE